MHTTTLWTRTNSWLGDVDQLRVTLGHLDAKKQLVQDLLESVPTALFTATGIAEMETRGSP